MCLRCISYLIWSYFSTHSRSFDNTRSFHKSRRVFVRVKLSNVVRWKMLSNRSTFDFIGSFHLRWRKSHGPLQFPQSDSRIAYFTNNVRRSTFHWTNVENNLAVVSERKFILTSGSIVTGFEDTTRGSLQQPSVRGSGHSLWKEPCVERSLLPWKLFDKPTRHPTREIRAVSSKKEPISRARQDVAA